MALIKCLASVSGTVARAAAAQAPRRAPHPSGLPALIAVPWQQQRGAGLRPRSASTSASEPVSYWDNPDKAKVNVYTDYTVYKGKSAMTLKVIKPTWAHVGSGLRMQREGTVLLEFAQSLGPQKYDWENKESFALSAVECGSVLDATDRGAGCDFIHDPNKGGPGEGSVIKKLSIKPAQERGWYFALDVTAGSKKSNIFCTLTDSELRLVKTLLAFLMPRLLGFDEHFAGAPVVFDGGPAPAAEAAPF